MSLQHIFIYIQSLITIGTVNAISFVTMDNDTNEPVKLVLNLILGLAAFASVAAMAAGGVSLALPSSADSGGYKAKRIIALGAVGLAVTMVLSILVSIIHG